MGWLKRINHTLLEKIQRLLSNVRLGKSFWAEALTYASHLINRLSLSAIGDKTPMEVCLRVVQDYDMLSVFGCLVYYHVKEDELDPQPKKAIFLSFKRDVKDYELRDPKDKKIIVSRDVS